MNETRAADLAAALAKLVKDYGYAAVEHGLHMIQQIKPADLAQAKTA